MSKVEDEIRETNLSTLSHANELATKVVMKVAGEAVATTVNGRRMVRNDISQAVSAKMQSCLITGEGSNKG